ncbi:hypothetical protein [Amycolatopsis sp. NPDC059657]|uniref:hypothetical protein n=1 Tax=Amycolatopsis sp. NPDC059657 TaxID=3346899 RepID=UPI00366C8A2C
MTKVVAGPSHQISPNGTESATTAPNPARAHCGLAVSSTAQPRKPGPLTAFQPGTSSSATLSTASAAGVPSVGVRPLRTVKSRFSTSPASAARMTRAVTIQLDAMTAVSSAGRATVAATTTSSASWKRWATLMTAAGR